MGETAPSLLGSVASTLSVLYCFFLLSIFIVPLATGLIVPEKTLLSYDYNTDGVLEYLQIYLAAGSIVFLLYLLLGLTRPSRSALNVTCHASAFVRVGGFVFGMGSVAYLTLRLTEDFYYNCKTNTPNPKLARFLSLTVTVLQMTAVILCSRIKIDQGWGAPHFGCMHLVATNLVTWVMTVYKESEHVMHLAEDIKTCVHLPEAYNTSDNGTSEARSDSHHIRKRGAGGGSICTPLSLEFEEIFYPFHIEFVLIGKHKPILTLPNSFLFSGAISFLSTWRAIAKLEDVKEETGLVKPRPLLYLAGLDFGSSRIGTLVAAPIILGSLGTSIYLRLRPERECDHETREVTKKVRVMKS